MNELFIDTNPIPLILGAQGDEELAQNVRIIATTFTHSVRFDVPFADTGNAIDSPLPFATARRIAGLAEAIEKYEPRLCVQSIVFRDEPDAAQNGTLYPVIRVTKKELF